MNTTPDQPFLSEPGFAWYCVRAQTKREHLAAAQLDRLENVEVFCPRIRFRRKTRRGKVWFEEALFPGYLFSRFDFFNQIRAVEGTIGVRGVVRFDGACLPVADEVIAALHPGPDHGPVVIPEPGIQPGDQAVITDGALRGLHALVTRVLPGGERIKILMELMGTAVEAEIAADALESIR
jgi:transcriptional antiterminator RfaH